MYKVFILLLVAGILIFNVFNDDIFRLNINGIETKWSAGSFGWYPDGVVWGIFVNKADSEEKIPGSALHILMNKPIHIGENDFEFRFQENGVVMLSSEDVGIAKLIINKWTYKFDGKIEAEIEIHKMDRNGKRWDIHGTIEAIQGTYRKGYYD